MSSTLQWFKSSYSSDSGGECIEVAFDHAVHIRDSKLQDSSPTFAVDPTTWTNFLSWAD